MDDLGAFIFWGVVVILVVFGVITGIAYIVQFLFQPVVAAILVFIVLLFIVPKLSPPEEKPVDYQVDRVLVEAITPVTPKVIAPKPEQPKLAPPPPPSRKQRIIRDYDEKLDLIATLEKKQKEIERDSRFTPDTSRSLSDYLDDRKRRALLDDDDDR